MFYIVIPLLFEFQKILLILSTPQKKFMFIQTIIKNLEKSGN